MFSCIAGNTISLTFTIRDTYGVTADIDEGTGKLKIYDKFYNILSTITDIIKIDNGIYQASYVTPISIPNVNQILHYEFSGKISDENIYVRNTFSVNFE